MKPPIMDRLIAVAAEHGGYVTPELATEVGVVGALLRKYAAAGRLEHRGHGLYRLPTFPYTAFDEYHRAVLWPAGRGVVSHESALALWDLADVNPRHINLTVPERLRRRGGERYRLWIRKLAPGDITEVQGVRTVTPLRAIKDALEAGTDPHLIGQAIDTGLRRTLIDSVDAETLRADLLGMTAAAAAR
jgi:predicted transcriptional regulator of viral defense system